MLATSGLMNTVMSDTAETMTVRSWASAFLQGHVSSCEIRQASKGSYTTPTRNGTMTLDGVAPTMARIVPNVPMTSCGMCLD